MKTREGCPSPESGLPFPRAMRKPKGPLGGLESSSRMVPSGKAWSTRPTGRTALGRPTSSTLKARWRFLKHTQIYLLKKTTKVQKNHFSARLYGELQYIILNYVQFYFNIFFIIIFLEKCEWLLTVKDPTTRPKLLKNTFNVLLCIF